MYPCRLGYIGTNDNSKRDSPAKGIIIGFPSSSLFTPGSKTSFRNKGKSVNSHFLHFFSMGFSPSKVKVRLARTLYGGE